jgi:hypothetical protein
MKYGIIFWGNSSDSKKIFILQKKIYRIIAGTKPQTPRDLFKKLRRMRWAGHVARMGEKRSVYRLLVGKPEGKRRRGGELL